MDRVGGKRKRDLRRNVSIRQWDISHGTTIHEDIHIQPAVHRLLLAGTKSGQPYQNMLSRYSSYIRMTSILVRKNDDMRIHRVPIFLKV